MKRVLALMLVVAAGACAAPALAQLLPPHRLQADWELGPTGTQAGLRALSAPTDRVLWAAGSAATVIRSEDGGASWHDCSPLAYQVEFRAIHAWSEKVACVASAGTPAIILRTTDAGNSWQEVYRHPSASAFFDGMQFWDEQRGMAFSDPVDSVLLIVETPDGGRSWRPIAPELLPPTLVGEAGFAASNSSICLGPAGAVWIGTGGAARSSSRIHHRPAWNAPWQVVDCPLPSGLAQGIFSLALAGDVMVAVGGDYRAEAVSQLTSAGSLDQGATWLPASSPPASFRSAVVAVPLRTTHAPKAGSAQTADSNSPQNPMQASGWGFVATGPTGTDYSADGSFWESISTHGFHALAISAESIFAVGANGKFGRLEFRQ